MQSSEPERTLLYLLMKGRIILMQQENRMRDRAYEKHKAQAAAAEESLTLHSSVNVLSL